MNGKKLYQYIQLHLSNEIHRLNILIRLCIQDNQTTRDKAINYSSLFQISLIINPLSTGQYEKLNQLINIFLYLASN